ncbi:hypothetical protein [Roseivirga pacifica]|uniref:hypothetical protein n=1 Tax=Roseivirga pacifica TaxID=1267423 RepID=UPI0020945314|nr:hypothetical protein [Roseivirga pacifica]MCO6358948.1 hypothetical protein [Roseivirga pacifica]MCO6365416.1 hypothetical protein [Roseivirga pacifica]MCO6371854.1 hypothetical protein [Roseivirga pacifica]MCO6376035.1 hypothetical protein [Roseivirga pacifica]MCO6379232.1 hypothetical protein [Roseivirga pacifica]
MRLHEIIEKLNFREKNSFLKIINELIPVSDKRVKIEKILSDNDGELKNLDSILISEVFQQLDNDFEGFVHNEFLETSSQFDILIDIIIRDGNSIMTREWFYSLYTKEVKKIKQKVKVLNQELSNSQDARVRDYRIYRECLACAFNNDIEKNLDPKITSDEQSILLTLAKELGLSQEEVRLINYEILPIKQKEVNEIIDDLKNKGVLFYSQKLNKVYVADEVVRVLRKIRGKSIADKHFRRVLKTLSESQLNLIIKRHGLEKQASSELKIKEIISGGVRLESALSDDIFKPDATLTERKKFINDVADSLNIKSLTGSTVEQKIDSLIEYFIELEKEDKIGISLEGYEKMLSDLGDSLKGINKALKEEFELSEDNVLNAQYLIDYNIKPRDVLDIISKEQLYAFCDSHGISKRGDEIANILESFRDTESLYVENYHLIGARDLNALKENGLQIKEADLGLMFEDVTESILTTLGFDVDNNLKREINTKKDKADIIVNLGDNNVILIECKTSKDNYNKFSSVSRQIKAYKKLVQANGYTVIKTLLVAPNFSDEFINDCRDDFELNLSLIEARTLGNIVKAFKEANLSKINRNLFMRDVLIQEEIVLKGLKK